MLFPIGLPSNLDISFFPALLGFYGIDLSGIGHLGWDLEVKFFVGREKAFGSDEPARDEPISSQAITTVKWSRFYLLWLIGPNLVLEQGEQKRGK